MAPSIPFNLARLRSYFFRLPLFTRLIILAILVFWVLELQSAWDVVYWGGLVPKEIGFQTMYRLNTYPLIHVNFFHALLDTAAILPLLERFESEHGTLTSAALFLGPLSTLPAGLYLLFEKAILRGNAAVQGASVWAALLLGSEAIKAYRSNPSLTIATLRIPTWTLPIAFIVVASVLLPQINLLAHACALAIGYVYGLGYLKFLAPPEKILRWIEGKANLLGRLPHYVSVDQKTFGRYGVLPSVTPSGPEGSGQVPLAFMGGGREEAE